MTTQRVPLHIEARALGADIRQIRANLSVRWGKSTASAAEIRAIWDYRAAGLTVEQARTKIQDWSYNSYHAPKIEPETGRILRLLHQKQQVLGIYTKYMTSPLDIPIWHSEPITWDHSTIRLIVGNHTIVVSRHEDVDWGEKYKSGRWPKSSTVSYRSRLLRIAPPTMREIIANGYDAYTQPIEIATEAKITHDCRGKWWLRVISDLLGAEVSKSYTLRQGEPTVAYKIVERNGCLRSVYEPEIVYPLNQWVSDDVCKNHEGGIYCYLDEVTAIDAAHNSDVFRREWAAGKTLVLCECLISGKRISYKSKIAVENLKIVKVLKEVTHGS